MWLKKEFLLFKNNLICLNINRRMGRLAYLWTIIGLYINLYSYLLILAFILDSSNTDFNVITPLLALSGMSILIISLIRRFNDIGWSKLYLILIFIIYCVIKYHIYDWGNDYIENLFNLSIFGFSRENL